MNNKSFFVGTWLLTFARVFAGVMGRVAPRRTLEAKSSTRIRGPHFSTLRLREAFAGGFAIAGAGVGLIEKILLRASPNWRTSPCVSKAGWPPLFTVGIRVQRYRDERRREPTFANKPQPEKSGQPPENNGRRNLGILRQYVAISAS